MQPGLDEATLERLAVSFNRSFETYEDPDQVLSEDVFFDLYPPFWRFQLQGRDAIRAFLRRKWAKELDYRLMKELWCFADNRISVRFEYEWHDAVGNWFRSHGNEHWEFAPNGLMQRRDASINDVPIRESDRRYHAP